MFCALVLWLAADVHFALEATTNAPLDIGGRLSIDLPVGLERLQLYSPNKAQWFRRPLRAIYSDTHLVNAAQLFRDKAAQYEATLNQ